MPSVENIHQNSDQTHQKHQSPTHVPTSFKWSQWGTHVCIAGSFDPPLPEWSAIEMPKNSENANEIVLDLLPGKKYRYKFVVDGQWVLDRTVTAHSDEHGNLNHEIEVEFPPTPPLLSEEEKGDIIIEKTEERKDEQVETEQEAVFEESHLTEEVVVEDLKEKHYQKDQIITEKQKVEDQFVSEHYQDEVPNKDQIEVEDKELHQHGENQIIVEESEQHQQVLLSNESMPSISIESFSNETNIKAKETPIESSVNVLINPEEINNATDEVTFEQSKEETMTSLQNEEVAVEDQKEQQYQKDQIIITEEQKVEHNEDQFTNEQGEVLNKDQIEAEDKELHQHGENQIIAEESEQHQQVLLSNESMPSISIESFSNETNIKAEETPNSLKDEGISSEIIDSTIATSTNETTVVESTFIVPKVNKEEVVEVNNILNKEVLEDIVSDNKESAIDEQVAQGNSEDSINESKITEFIEETTKEKDEHDMNNITTEKTVVSTDINYSSETGSSETTILSSETNYNVYGSSLDPINENEENVTEYIEEENDYTPDTKDEFTENVAPEMELSEEAANSIILENTWAKNDGLEETIPNTWLETNNEPSEYVWRDEIERKWLNTETKEITEKTNYGETQDLGSILVKEDPTTYSNESYAERKKHEIIVKETIVEDKTKESGGETGKEDLVAKENIISTSDVKEKVVVEPSSVDTVQNEEAEDIIKAGMMSSIPTSVIAEQSNEHQDENIAKAIEKLKLINKKCDNYEDEAHSIVAGIIPTGKISQPTKKSREISTKTVKSSRKNSNEISRRDSEYITQQENLIKIDFGLVYIITSLTTAFTLGIISMLCKSLFGLKKNNK